MPARAEIVDGRLRGLRDRHSAAALTDAATVLGSLIDERKAESRAGHVPSRIFGRIMEIGVDDAPMIAMHALLALAPGTRRFPPAGIPVDQIAALQDGTEHRELTELMRSAGDRLRRAANERAADCGKPAPLPTTSLFAGSKSEDEAALHWKRIEPGRYETVEQPGYLVRKNTARPMWHTVFDVDGPNLAELGTYPSMKDAKEAAADHHVTAGLANAEGLLAGAPHMASETGAASG